MPSLEQQALKSIAKYHSAMKALHAYDDPERAHMVAMNAANLVLGILHHIPAGIGQYGIEYIKHVCNFPKLNQHLDPRGYQLGDKTLFSNVGVGPGMFKNYAPLELFGPDGIQAAFVGIGGVKLLEEPGNPRIRHVSMIPDISENLIEIASINRYGLPSLGVDAVHRHLANARDKGHIHENVFVMANICNGVNTPKENKPGELGAVTAGLISCVDGIEENISCPNQDHGKELAEEIGLFRESLLRIRDAAQGKPIFVKVSPDMSREMLAQIIEASHDLVTGYTSTNTTTNSNVRQQVASRMGLANVLAQQEEVNHRDTTIRRGGMSGNGLLPLQLQMTQWIHELVPEIIVIGGGGVIDEKSAFQTIKAGARFVFTVTGLAQLGLGVIPLITIGATKALREKN